MKKTLIILFTSIIAVTGGTALAYYNTASLGYGDANLISADEDSIKILSFDIYYNDIIHIFEKVKEKTPDNFITI